MSANEFVTGVPVNAHRYFARTYASERLACVLRLRMNCASSAMTRKNSVRARRPLVNVSVRSWDIRNTEGVGERMCAHPFFSNHCSVSQSFNPFGTAKS